MWNKDNCYTIFQESKYVKAMDTEMQFCSQWHTHTQFQVKVLLLFSTAINSEYFS